MTIEADMKDLEALVERARSHRTDSQMAYQQGSKPPRDGVNFEQQSVLLNLAAHQLRLEFEVLKEINRRLRAAGRTVDDVETIGTAIIQVSKQGQAAVWLGVTLPEEDDEQEARMLAYSEMIKVGKLY